MPPVQTSITMQPADGTQLCCLRQAVLHLPLPLILSLTRFLPMCPPSPRNENRQALKEQVQKVRDGEADPKSLP